MRLNMKRPVSFFISVGLVIIVVFFIFQGIKHMVHTDPRKARMLSAAMPVETAQATVASLEEIVGATGKVQQSATVTLTAQISSRILSIPIDLGSIVKEGQELIRWDDRLYQAAFRSAKERVETAKVQLDHAVRQLARLEALEAEGIGSTLDVEEARIQAAKARLEEAQAEELKTRAKLDLEQAILVSPANGIILDLMVNPQEATMVDQPLLILGALDHVFMVADVSEERISSIHFGQSAVVSYDAYPGEPFTGTIVKIDPKTDPETRTFAVYIKISNPGLKLKPGLTGFSRIQQQKSVLTIPSVAVMSPVRDRPNVFVVDNDSRVHLREVRIGMVAQGMTEILEGIREGEIVVTVGQLHLKENDVVHSKTIPTKK